MKAFNDSDNFPDDDLNYIIYNYVFFSRNYPFNTLYWFNVINNEKAQQIGRSTQTNYDKIIVAALLIFKEIEKYSEFWFYAKIWWNNWKT